jgi:hypothetical protein
LGHRLIVTSECGYIYYVEDGNYIVFYDIGGDDTEYFGKIARYSSNLIVIGGYKNINVLTSKDGGNYNLCKIDMDVLNHSDAIKFMDDFLVLASSSYNTLIFFPIEELYNNVLKELKCKCYIAQLKPFVSFKLNSIDFLNDQFIISLKTYNKKTWDSGIIYLDKDFNSFKTQAYGWKASKLSVIDGKIYLLCNYVYGTNKKPSLVVDGKIVVSFHETYELNDFAVSDECIYIVGRCIVESDGTTINKGIILILDRKYNLVDIQFITGSGALLGCLSLDRDYANDAVTYNCLDFVKEQIKVDQVYKSLTIIEDLGK